MDYRKKQDREKTLSIAIIILVSVTVFSLVIAILLFFKVESLEKKLEDNREIVIKPMVNPEQEFSFIGERGDANYLRLMGLSFLSLRVDVNSQNIEYSHEILLSYATDELKQRLIPVLSQEKQRVMADNGSSSFYVKKIRVSPSTGLIDVEGELKFYYGLKETPTVHKHYQLRIETRKNQFKLTDFVEIIE